MMDNFAKHAKKERQILKLKEELKQFGEAPTFRSIKKRTPVLIGLPFRSRRRPRVQPGDGHQGLQHDVLQHPRESLGIFGPRFNRRRPFPIDFL